MTSKEHKFVKTVWEYYRCYGRKKLPWRCTKNPYRILVSEIMLQQTQVDRVLPKYKSFLKRFPTIRALARASLGDVLREWQGLGYNRRAKMLHECTKKIVGEHRGKFPRTHAELMKLPGIGHYTAGAVLAFAYQVPTPVIETNIRSVYIHHFFKDDIDVSDDSILKCIERTLDAENSREWYYALMDYGTYIKKEFGNPNRRSKHHITQKTFTGSDRHIRGMLIKLLIEKSYTRTQLLKVLPFEDVRIDAQLAMLNREGMILKKNMRYRLPW